MAPSRSFRAVVFDLDNTLYAPQSGLFAAIDARIGIFIQERLGLSAAAAEQMRHRFRSRYHITLRGLMVEHGIDPGDYLDFVHAVPVDLLLAPDPRLRDLLDRLGCPAHIFTNGSREHALRVLGRLGVTACFGEIFDIAATGYLPKPEPAAFRLVLRTLGLEPREVLYVDDLPRNLATAADLGMTTVLISPQAPGEASLRHWARDLDQLASVVFPLLAAGPR
jgi:putative hydrolase of the HAD superfamily